MDVFLQEEEDEDEEQVVLMSPLRETLHLKLHSRKAEAVFSSRFSDVSIKCQKKVVFLDLLKSVTVLQSSGLWKPVIHHCLAPLDACR